VVVCPAFADSISEGDVRWEKAVGDAVGVDEVVCEIETDKTSVPVPTSVAGVIEALLVEDGATVTPGTELLKIKVGAIGSAPPAAKKVRSVGHGNDVMYESETIWHFSKRKYMYSRARRLC
jgi:2-oxoglutarate dehydrogenase E2 component (dihydrolipoamide succinyltransferase)